jgi:hypothetical protein
MRRSTAVRVLLGIFVVATPLVWLIGDRRLARQLLATGLIVGFFVALVAFRKRPRREAMRDEARRLGLEWSSTGASELLDAPFALFNWSRAASSEFDNVLSGSWHGLAVRVFDYVYARGENRERRLSCGLVAIPGGWPTTVIRPEGATTTLADHVGMPDIEFESETFNRAFDVRSDDRRFASAIVDGQMMAWLLELGHGWGFEIRGRWILGYRDQVQPWEIGEVLSTLEAFLVRIPRAARSLYPEALPRRPDVPA